MSFVYILAAILIFGVLIAVHELGHFLAAKLCGVQVNEFSIGMGPAVWHRKKGETAYSFRILPIGGYDLVFVARGMTPRLKSWQLSAIVAKLFAQAGLPDKAKRPDAPPPATVPSARRAKPEPKA